MQLSIIFIALTLAAGSIYSSDLPIVASRLVTGPASHVELTNTGNQPATAWSLAITTQADGRTRRVVHSRDTYLAEVTRGLPGSQEELDWLLPGRTRKMTLDPLPGDATAQLLAVVLEDGTGLGDAQTLKGIFDRRVAERDELRRVTDAFHDVLVSKKGVAGLEALKDRLAPPAKEESTPHRAAREAVEAFLRTARAGKVDEAEQSLRAYVAFVERQHKAAVKHSQQKSAASTR